MARLRGFMEWDQFSWVATPRYNWLQRNIRSETLAQFTETSGGT